MALCMATAVQAAGAKDTKPQMEGYLFAYFEGGGDKNLQEHLRFAVSADAVNWYALNDNRPVVASDSISESGGIRNIRGEVVRPKNPTQSEDKGDNNALRVAGARIPTNFGIWWDGDLLRELLDHETVSKYDWENRRVVDVKRFDGMFNNGTKSNPCLQADIIGDWREEVIIRNRESSELRIYTTTIPTEHRIDCLMLDIPYRLSVATQNVGYNQPPETGYYIGPDRTDYLK